MHVILLFLGASGEITLLPLSELQLQALKGLVKKYKSCVWVPALLFCVIVAIGVWAVLAADKLEVKKQREAVRSLLQKTAQTIIMQLQGLVQPTIAMAAFAARVPHWPTLTGMFHPLAAELLEQVSGQLHGS